MEINKLIKHLEDMRDNHNVTGVKIPRLGYHGTHDIDEEEFTNPIIKDRVIAIEGEFDYEDPDSMRSMH